MVADIIGWMGAICFTISGIPQAWKCCRQKHADGLSNSFLLFWLAGEACLIGASLGRFGWVNWLMLSYISGALCALIILYYKIFRGS